MPLTNARAPWTQFFTLALATVVVGVVRLVRLFLSVKGNKSYWLERAASPVQPGDFIYVALGDSVANGIGATRPLKGYVGLLAEDIERRTGRRVHVVNVSVTGATAADVVRDQLPQIREYRADLVTLDVGANDVNKRVLESDFVRDLGTIMDALPSGKTIVADLPTFARGPKQSTLLRLNEEIYNQIAAHDFKLAPIFKLTSATIHDWRTYGADFFHPSNRGHRNWYRAFEPQLDSVIAKVSPLRLLSGEDLRGDDSATRSHR